MFLTEKELNATLTSYVQVKCKFKVSGLLGKYLDFFLINQDASLITNGFLSTCFFVSNNMFDVFVNFVLVLSQSMAIGAYGEVGVVIVVPIEVVMLLVLVVVIHLHHKGLDHSV